MSAAEGYTPRWAICMMEGCNWRGGSRCVNCGARLRCLCGRFVRDDHMAEHCKTCPTVEDFLGGCPICEGGNGSACGSHFL